MENNNKGGNFRNTIPPFTMVDNRVVENKNLSMKAKGLYLIIMHYVTIPNFTLNKRYLMSLSKEGERAFDSTWKELKDAGYLKQYRLKGEDGKWVYEYELLIEPIIESDVKEMQNKKPSTSEKVESYNNNVKKNNFTNNSISRNKKKYTKKDKLEKNSNNEVVEVIEKSCVKIRKEDLKDCISEFTDIDKLKEALTICEINNNHGIKSLKMAYRYGDVNAKRDYRKQDSMYLVDSKVIVNGKLKSVKDMTEEEIEEKIKAKWGRI